METDEDALPFMLGPAGKIVRRNCDAIKLNLVRLKDMVTLERDVAGMGRRHGVFQELKQIVEDSLLDLE